MSKKQEFVICLANRGFDDLEVWKVYRVLPDAKAAGVGCLRVIDESGEDYLYPAGLGYHDGSQAEVTRRCDRPPELSGR